MHVQEKYSIPEICEPTELKLDIDTFCEWSSEPFNLERGAAYAHAVQPATLDGHRRALKAFVGFVRMYHHVELFNLTLGVYRDPALLASFVSYLRAREVTKGHILSHVSLARKVNDYLAAGADVPQPDKQHAAAMDSWLGKLELQVRSAVPAAIPAGPGLPPGQTVLTWALAVGRNAAQAVRLCMAQHGHLVHRVAQQVHDALLVSLVTGAHVPPCRLALIKSWHHPDVAHVGCQREACTRPDCPGNRLELVVQADSDDGEGEQLWSGLGVRSHVVHGPKQERGRFTAINYLFPPGDLTRLMVTHIKYGHQLLVQEQHPPVTALFVGKNGSDITHNDSLFTQLWNGMMVRCPVAASLGLRRFPPNAGRTIFVEAYTGAHGQEPGFWDGAATVMGNSVRQWAASYRPNRLIMGAEQAVFAHASFVESLMGAAST